MSYLWSNQTVYLILFKCFFLASSSKKPKLTIGNEPSSSSKSEEDNRSCLMHFVDKDIFDDIYLANGALIFNNKVLTTCDFLKPYDNNLTNNNLYVYSNKWKTKGQTSKVNHVYIDHEGDSQLAVASVSSCT